MVKPSATVELPCFSWFWADDVRIACPPGIDCFMAGEEYNHGGLSLQECVVPQIVIRPGGTATVSAKIESFKWAGLRCRIKVTGDYDGCMVDLRDKAADPGTSLARRQGGRQGRIGGAGGHGRKSRRDGDDARSARSCGERP